MQKEKNHSKEIEVIKKESEKNYRIEKYGYRNLKNLLGRCHHREEMTEGRAWRTD